MASWISFISRCARCNPPSRVRTARASPLRPCLASQRGLSGTRNRAARKSTAGSAPEASIHRQPKATFQISFAGEAISQLTTETTTMPVMMATWFSETRRPRTPAGATSAMYSGESIEVVPTAKPASSRAATNPLR